MSLFRHIDKDINILLDNLPVGIVRLNSSKACIYANKFVYSILDVTSCEEITHTMKVCIHEEDRDTENTLCSNFLNNLVESESTFRLYDKIKKEYRWIMNKRTIVKPSNSGNTTFSFMYTLQDVHENKLMEINLRNETMKAEQAYNHKSIFLANISHEVRTPLNGIIGMLTLLEDTSLNLDQQDYVSMIKECSFNLMSIINDILDYSKLEAGKIPLNLKTMSLRECIESTNDIVLSKIYEKSLEYSYNIQPEIPELIKSDSNRIKQVLLNLLSNSIKFTDSGTIFLNIELLSQSEYNFLFHLHDNDNTSSDSLHSEYYDSNNSTDNISIYEINDDNDNSNFIFLRFDITDTGCGIDSSDYNKLFKSFTQIDNRLTCKIYQGTGLGLAISKELISLLKGQLWLDWSEVAKGSRFSFIIKVEKCNEIPLKYIDNEEDLKVLKNKNVLILDDNVYNRISLTGMVSKWGMKAYTFSNPDEALYFSKITHFDIGLIDICMPKIDGPTFATKLKDYIKNPYPLIALSSISDKFTSKSSKYFKVSLVKPIKEYKLKHVCIDILKQYSLNYITSESSPLQLENSPTVQKKDDINLDNKTIDSYLIHNELTKLKDNIRILIAEDIYINQKVITSFLNKMEFHNIQTVENGQQCLELVHQLDFDIILLDIRMPIMNGDIVLKHINEYYQHTINKKKPFIIAVTAYCLKDDKEKYLNMGFDDYIPKPVSYDELHNCLDTYLQKLLND